MSKSRKQIQQEIYKREMQKKREAIWNPDLPPKEQQHFHKTCERMFQALAEVSRPVALMTLPAHNQPARKSHLGGSMLMTSSADWPMANEKPLAAVMEVYLHEVPVLPQSLVGFELLQVFLELHPGEHQPEYRGGVWEVRRLPITDHLTPLSQGLRLDSTPVLWNLEEHDTPVYPDDLDLVPDDIREAFGALPNSSALLVDRFPSGPGTRIGGWPQWVTGSDLAGAFCLQIDGTDVGIDLGFDGSLFFGFDIATNTWDCVWEIG